MGSRTSTNSANNSAYCAIDFGTSNSAMSVAPSAAQPPKLIELEPGRLTIPTAVFYNAEDTGRYYGRDAVATYVDGHEGRLMRSMKTILGSDLADQSTEISPGYAVRFMHIIESYLQFLKRSAETQCGKELSRVVLGRPVFFVDGNEVRDQKAQDALAAAARAVGFKDIAFQFEPIAAALDYEAKLATEEIVLVADIGGGTSDFSIVRVGPQRHQKLERKSDVLANHGVHVAGTDFDQAVNLQAIMPHLGLGSEMPVRTGETARAVPSSVYHELATWHLINTVYSHASVASLKQMRTMYANQTLFDRLMFVVEHRLGHQLSARAESAKIDAATTDEATVDLNQIDATLKATLSIDELETAVNTRVERIVNTARETISLSGLRVADIDTLYFTGGSTGLGLLGQRIGAAFPDAKHVHGDRFASVGAGLGIYAQRVFGDS